MLRNLSQIWLLRSSIYNRDMDYSFYKYDFLRMAMQSDIIICWNWLSPLACINGMQLHNCVQYTRCSNCSLEFWCSVLYFIITKYKSTWTSYQGLVFKTMMYLTICLEKKNSQESLEKVCIQLCPINIMNNVQEKINQIQALHLWLLSGNYM